jgi:addiction module HigA family antidote
MSTAQEAIHPGEVLHQEFLEPMGVSQYRLAQAIDVPARRIKEIVLGERGISPETALRLARAFGTSDRFWTNLQTRYDLELVAKAKGDELDRIVPLPSA